MLEGTVQKFDTQINSLQTHGMLYVPRKDKFYDPKKKTKFCMDGITVNLEV